MKHGFFAPIIAATAFTVAACAPGPSSLVGTYAVEERGKLTEFLRVERRGTDYILLEKQGGRWRDPVTIVPIDKSKLEALLKKPVSVKFAGLGNDHVAIFKMPAGWQSEQFQTKTGFWLLTILGPIELHKQ